MFSLRLMKETIEVDPKSLCREWRKKFLDTLRRQKERMITPGVGAILFVEKLVRVEPPRAENSKLFATVEFEALNFFPSIGEIYTGEVTMVIPLGLVIEAENMVRVLIQPANMPAGYKFDNSRKVFTNGVHSFTNQDVVRFRISNVQYKPAQINCIGSLKDVPQLEKEEKTGKGEKSLEVIDDSEESLVLEPVDPFED